MANYKPFSESELNTHALYIGFLAEDPADQAKAKLLSLATDLDAVHLNGREVYWLCRTTFRDSKFSGALTEKTLAMQTTFRNSNTIKRLASKYQ